MGEQLAYYRLGAREYDAANRTLLARADRDGESRRRGYRCALAHLGRIATGRDVLEIAGGTGIYTRHLASIASRLTVVDASPESLEINRSSNGSAPIDVEYIVSDIFTWRPSRRFEAVVFAFWLSHVPDARFDAFWRVVDQALSPDGAVVIIDAPAPVRVPEPAPVPRNFFTEQRVDDEFSIRSLADGRRFRIVRILWAPPDLQARLAGLGWHVELDESSAWLIGVARRSAGG
jgi:ubiquinone/menaquinone biosynthesis C-methylase UbiE